MEYSVKQVRKLADLTQVQMANALGVSRDTYRRIEENPETATIAQGKRIAEVTGFPFDVIFFRSDSTKSRIAI
ncbi:MAG: helix-turn-helix domain-containing protein [Oscillospiraceae bacterium]|nr:helix-turn-helix domain-containing protein [Oscillospiraceae bacterium]